MYGNNIFCSLCGAPLGGTSAVHQCTGTLTSQPLLRNPSPQYGWECSRCGCVMNPTFPTCWNCRGEKSGALLDTREQNRPPKYSKECSCGQVLTFAFSPDSSHCPKCNELVKIYPPDEGEGNE